MEISNQYIYIWEYLTTIYLLTKPLVIRVKKVIEVLGVLEVVGA